MLVSSFPKGVPVGGLVDPFGGGLLGVPGDGGMGALMRSALAQRDSACSKSWLESGARLATMLGGMVPDAIELSLGSPKAAFCSASVSCTKADFVVLVAGLNSGAAGGHWPVSNGHCRSGCPVDGAALATVVPASG